MKTVKAGKLEIGSGLPKIAVPITGKNEAEISAQAKAISCSSADIVEWRADLFEYANDSARINSAISIIRSEIGKMPLLFTLRTASEGGNADISKVEYLRLISLAAQNSLIDLCDVEMLSNPEAAAEAVKICALYRIPVIGSRHHFDKTPSASEMIDEVLQIKARGADIVKLAVMPQNENDVWRLMSLSSLVLQKISCPLVLIAMGAMGAKTRAFSELFSSAITFSSFGDSSAPGQLDAEMTARALKLVHTTLSACNGD
ncbi:MAG: type I 3-dehydroquinate dehydratase [Eubacteriales bacterium]|nr:type I 3-dehydroquinate dehydratase [Eubacteriales bacterium]MDD3883079.1 type I 3-dehydroquinate dehydratase [Eubacteriales bacterium]MDD4512604.1 type I 3-dehydroquinate dehydratase [Eubacteriales bacterium]